MPEKSVAQRIDVQRDEDRAAAEQGNRRDRKTNRDVRSRARIHLQTEVAPAAQTQCAQERPEKQERGDEQGAMEVGLEIKAGQARQDAMLDEELAGPKKRRGSEGAEQDDTSEIEQ